MQGGGELPHDGKALKIVARKLFGLIAVVNYLVSSSGFIKARKMSGLLRAISATDIASSSP